MTDASLWPDAQQRELLLAALGDGDAALAHFAAWHRAVDWGGDVDGGSFRLLPLLHANLVRLGCDHPSMARLRGIYRHGWCKAQTHRQHGIAAVEVLAGAGIPVLASKGLVLANIYYDNPALRPMSDIDIMVPAPRALDALAALTASGWMETSQSRAQWGSRRAAMMVLNHGIGLQHDRYGEIDLHWRLSAESGTAAVGDRYWQHAVPFEIEGAKLLRLDPAHLLLHVIIHGLRPNILPPLRWVADAAMVLRRDGATLDWPRLHGMARDLHVGHRLQSGLAYLRDEIGIALPGEALADAVPPSWVERTEEWIRQAESKARSPRQRQALAMAATLPRLAVGDDRGRLPRLALDWGRRRLRPAR